MQPDNPFQLARLSWERRDLAAARGHIAAAVALDPGYTTPPVHLLHARLLVARGETDAANAVLEALLAANPSNIWALLQLAEIARHGSDAAAMRGHLDKVLALDPVATGRLTVEQLLQKELSLVSLLVESDAEAAALEHLQQLGVAYPDRAEVHHQLARLSWERRDLAAARGHIAAAVALDPGYTTPPVHLLHARLLVARGETDAANAVLEALLAANPSNIWALLQLAEIARHGSDAAAMRGHLDLAIENLKGQLEQDSHNPQLLFLLIKAYRITGRIEEERACLAAAITVDPTSIQLLAHIYTHFSNPAHAEVISAATDLLRPRIGIRAANQLEVNILLNTMQYLEALRLERRGQKTRPREADALRLAKALFGMQRYRTGMRYLRFCLRRWGGSRVLQLFYVSEALKLGRYEEVRAHIDAMEGQSAWPDILEGRFLLQAYQGDVMPAAKSYEGLWKLGQIRQQHRNLLNTLKFNQLDPKTEGSDFPFTDGIHAEHTPPHFRAGLVGQQMMEFELEQRFLSQTGGFDTPTAWLVARPGSTCAALRVVGEWDAATNGAPLPGPATSVIPKQIFQYWDSASVPDAIARMFDSWARAEGFTHRPLQKADAIAFLRANMGPKWVRAFQLARNPAEEADLLRLCLLACEGGVYADADDYLYGDLERLLAAGPGAILYRETLGGGIGNNFIAAPPRHPVIEHAALLARNAILRRDNETTWSKTGPGLLTRVVAHYLVRTAPDEARSKITLLDWPTVAGQIGMHNPVSYKKSPKHWNQTVQPSAAIWNLLLSALQQAAGAAPNGY